MPIEVDIPIEISSYQKKVIFGLTLRQLLTLPLALILSLLSFFLIVKKLGMTIDTASWFIMLLALPPLAIGFIRPNDEPFERWCALRLQRILQPQKLYYNAHTTIIQTKEVSHRVFQKKQSSQKPECSWLCSDTRRAQKHRRKQTAKRLKAAKKAYKSACKKHGSVYRLRQDV